MKTLLIPKTKTLSHKNPTVDYECNPENVNPKLYKKVLIIKVKLKTE